MRVRKLSGMFRKRAAVVAFSGKRSQFGGVGPDQEADREPAHGDDRRPRVGQSGRCLQIASRPAPPASSVTGWPLSGS